MTKTTPRKATQWPRAGLHGGTPCPNGPPRIRDEPLPTTLWKGPDFRSAAMVMVNDDVCREPPRNWFDNPRKGWEPFQAQVCNACGIWRPATNRVLPPLRRAPLPPPTLIGA